MYSDVLDDPKVQKLHPTLFKVWVNLLCLASRSDGMLPGVDDIAFALRVDEEAAAGYIRELVERGLLDAGDGLTPHNWNERQFKSDTAENASERKRKQRARDKKPESHNNVTADDCDSHNEVTPPEQNRAEQIQNTQERVCDDPKHWVEVQGYLKDSLQDVNDWELEFLHSIKWTQSLSPAQSEKLKIIRQRLRSTEGGGFALPVVKRGTPAYDAWIEHYRKKGRASFYESRESLTVPTEFPQQEQAA
jgi:hypothetical protein